MYSFDEIQNYDPEIAKAIMVQKLPSFSNLLRHSFSKLLENALTVVLQLNHSVLVRHSSFGL